MIDLASLRDGRSPPPLEIDVESPSNDGRTSESRTSFLSTDSIDFVANAECVTWTVYDGLSSRVEARSEGRYLRFRPHPPPVQYGRKEPLIYTVVAQKGNETRVIALRQDEIDTVRQQYVDRAKSGVPERQSFIAPGDVFGHQISYREIRSRDGASWAIFGVFGQFDRWRRIYGRPFSINRGYTTPVHNDSIHGAARNSQHLFGTAVDVASNKNDWFAKRDAVRDAGACLEPLKISGWGHVHADWRGATACADSWKYRPRPVAALERPVISGFRPGPLQVHRAVREPRAPINAESVGRHRTGVIGVAAALIGSIVAEQVHAHVRRAHTPCASCVKLLSEDWVLDAVILEELDLASLTEAQRLWLISRLETYEDAVVRRDPDDPPLCEDFSSFYDDLTLAVADLSDRRAIDVLAHVSDVAPTVSRRLAEFGDPAVQPVIDLLRDPALADSTAYTLGQFLEGFNEGHVTLSSENVRRIRRALMRLARRRGELQARGTAVVSLAQLMPDAGLNRLFARLSRHPGLLPFVERARSIRKNSGG